MVMPPLLISSGYGVTVADQAHHSAERGPRTLRGKTPLNATLIVDTAERLTADVGLSGWTIRQLAAELNCWPAAIYHHVGDRSAVHQAVADRVVYRMPYPCADLPWHDWFFELLIGTRPILRAYPGVARWLILRGPLVPSGLRILDRGVRVLRRDGFGDDAPAVYITLLNAAVLLIMAQDDRDTEGTETKMTIAQAITTYRHDPRPGLAMMAEYLLRTDTSEGFYTYTVNRAIAGAHARLEQIRCGE